VLTPDSVAVIPDAVSLVAGKSQQFVAVVASAEPAEKVTWIRTPPLGEVDQNGLYTPPSPVPDNSTVKVIAVDRFGRKASATVTLATKPWSGPGVYLLGIYLFCVFSLVVFLVGLVPERVSNIQDLKTDRAQADAALQKLQAQRGQASGTVPGLDTQIAAATDLLKDKDTALIQATGLYVNTILIHEDLKRDKNGLNRENGLNRDNGGLNREVDLMLLVLLAGALGSFLHMAQSFSDFAGNRTLKSSWSWWYALRPFVGAALALIIYAVIRGGLVSVSASPGFDSTGLNPYGLIAGAALAGLFSKDATQKLGEVFRNLFNTDKANQTQDTLLPQSQTPAPSQKPAAGSAGGTTAPVR
jgi:hypothetical protein